MRCVLIYLWRLIYSQLLPIRNSSASRRMILSLQAELIAAFYSARFIWSLQCLDGWPHLLQTLSVGRCSVSANPDGFIRPLQVELTRDGHIYFKLFLLGELLFRSDLIHCTPNIFVSHGHQCKMVIYFYVFWSIITSVNNFHLASITLAIQNPSL